MVIAAVTVHMAVRQFISGRGSNINNFNVKIQYFASQRMIAVDGNIIAIDFRNSNHAGTEIDIGVKLHAHLNIHAFEHFT